MSFPAFSGLFAILTAAAVAAPDDIPTYFHKCMSYIYTYAYNRTIMFIFTNHS